ncbi:MAG: NAD+ synthase [Thiopseudomonas sp.]|nr:NAD+ synthase [Thiopseudomonas sp.]
MPALPRITLAQIHVRSGDLHANLESIRQAVTASQAQCDLLVFPALALTGQMLQDRWLYHSTLAAVDALLPELCALSQQTPFLVGLPREDNGQLYQSLCLFHHGQLVWQYHKQLPDNDPLTEENRYFAAGQQTPAFELDGLRLGVALGDEIHSPHLQQQLSAARPALVINPSADSYWHDCLPQRLQQLADTARALGCPLLRVNPVGGQDERVQDGHSCVLDAKGQLLQRAQGFVPERLDVALTSPKPVAALPSAEALTWQALVLALRDYVAACHFKGALLGLSGGIDSALVLALAVDALGADQVTAVMLPYHYTAQISQDDAAEQARILGVAYHVAPVAPLVEPFVAQLQPLLQHWPAPTQDTTEQNLQARSRGMLLMALSNRSGALLLTTSNKSEMAVGYCTLYGDMCGGFALLKDIPKTLVYRLAAYRNTLGAAIPERVITRPPSAELAPGQEDSDSLPPYPLLDEIVRRYVDETQSLDELLAAGLDADWTRRMLRLIDLNEFKRRQAAPGPKMSQRGFGRERRMPMSGRL